MDNIYTSVYTFVWQGPLENKGCCWRLASFWTDHLPCHRGLSLGLWTHSGQTEERESTTVRHVRGLLSQSFTFLNTIKNPSSRVMECICFFNVTRTFYEGISTSHMVQNSCVKLTKAVQKGWRNSWKIDGKSFILICSDSSWVWQKEKHNRGLLGISLHVHQAVFLLWLLLTFPDMSIVLSHTSPVPCRRDRRIFRSREILQGLS